jgi:CHAT domain-containing protein
MPESDAQRRIAAFVNTTAGAPLPPFTSAHAADVRFKLEVVEEIPDDVFAPTARMPLAPATRVHIRVTTCDSGEPSQRSIKINKRAVLRLVVKLAVQTDARVVNPELDITAEQLETLEHDFELVLADQCARGDAEIVLLVSADGRRAQPAAVLLRSVDGNVNQIDDVLLSAAKIELDTSPPEHFAILHFEETQPGYYRIRGWNRFLPLLKLEQQQLEDKIGLARFVEQSVDPKDVVASIRNVSRRAPQQLLVWLQRLHGLYGEKLCLVIADHTTAEIPWEALEFADNKYLGASCAVARWIPVQKREIWAHLRVSTCVQRGEIVAHLDEQQLAHVEIERRALQPFRTSFCNDSDALETRLSASLDDVSLVYLAAHGMFVYDKRHEIAVGSLENPSQRLVAVRLEQVVPGTTRPLFFVNACHSARLARDGSGLYGMPEVVLARLASGYIGTLGPVGVDYAPLVGQALLDCGQKSEGINPAEVLRQVRARAVAEYSEQGSKKTATALVWAFMYVYFGNPLAQWQVVAADHQCTNG